MYQLELLRTATATYIARVKDLFHRAESQNPDAFNRSWEVYQAAGIARPDRLVALDVSCIRTLVATADFDLNLNELEFVSETSESHGTLTLREWARSWALRAPGLATQLHDPGMQEALEEWKQAIFDSAAAATHPSGFDFMILFDSVAGTRLSATYAEHVMSYANAVSVCDPGGAEEEARAIAKMREDMRRFALEKGAGDPFEVRD